MAPEGFFFDLFDSRGRDKINRHQSGRCEENIKFFLKYHHQKNSKRPRLTYRGRFLFIRGYRITPVALVIIS